MLVVLLGGLGIGTLVSGDDEPATEPVTVPVEEVDGEPSTVVVDRRPVAVTYRVEGYTGGDLSVVDTERRWVRSPYESRIETVPVDDADSPPSFLQIAGFGVLQTGRESEEPAVLAVEPVVAAGDVFVDVSALAPTGKAREVLDRRCEVYRNGGPIDVGLVSEPSQSPLDFVDLCVAEDGLLLHEAWVIDSGLFRVRVATEIDESPSFDDDTFVTGGMSGEGPQTGVLAALTPDSMPPGVAYYELPAVPDGFTHRGRYGYTPPRPQLQPDQPEPTKVALVLDVFDADDGSGLLVVANGGTSDRSPFVQPDEDSELVDLGPLGEGYAVRGLRQNEVRIGFDGGRFLRVWGTLPVDDLVALTSTLVPTTDPDATLTPA
jgi:hypothetical protein